MKKPATRRGLVSSLVFVVMVLLAVFYAGYEARGRRIASIEQYNKTQDQRIQNLLTAFSALNVRAYSQEATIEQNRRDQQGQLDALRIDLLDQVSRDRADMRQEIRAALAARGLSYEKTVKGNDDGK